MQVRGYRSALFGMTEAEVRAAASRDFGVPPGKLAPGPDGEGGNRTLVLPVSYLEPVNRTGLISYVFDKATLRLISVNLLWSGGARADFANRDHMIASASAVTADLLGHSWAPLSQLRGVPVDPQTLIVFAAVDEAGAGVEVRLQNIQYEIQGAPRPPARPATGQPLMRLSFVQQAKRPDLRQFLPDRSKLTAELSR
jgi:hypothetical protein